MRVDRRPTRPEREIRAAEVPVHRLADSAPVQRTGIWAGRP